LRRLPSAKMVQRSAMAPVQRPIELKPSHGSTHSLALSKNSVTVVSSAA
jgi:hypothetical protein